MQNAREFLPKLARVYPAAAQNEQIDSRTGVAPSADRDASADRICCPVQHGQKTGRHYPYTSRRLPPRSDLMQTRQALTTFPLIPDDGIHTDSRLRKTPRLEITATFHMPRSTGSANIPGKQGAAAPASTPLWRRVLFRPKTLVAMAAAAAIGLLVPLGRQITPALASRPEFQLTPATVTLPPAPAWIPQNLAGQVFNTAGLGDTLSLLDPTVCERVAAAFHTHPWIERVVSVQKRWPARIVVDVIYREPVAMVRGIDGFYPVDRHGILLPARDFSALDVQAFPVIEQVTSAPVGRLGEAWGDPAVTAAARLAEVLLQNADQTHNWWQLLNLAAIVVPQNVTLPESADELQFELRTKGGSRILWGRGPDSRNPAELNVTGKLQRLRELHTRYGSPDGKRDQWLIDIRPLQGIDRRMLSASRKTDSSRN